MAALMETPILLLSIVVVVLAITTHEAAHAWVSDKLGDNTARLLGRVTLNPIPHIDLRMTILLPGILLLIGSPFIFGGAKPVPFNPYAFRKPFRDIALTAAAGPLSNLIQALLWAFVLKLFIQFGVWDTTSQGLVVLQLGIFVNVVLFVFNLIPIPPLDGSRILSFFLSGEARRQYMSLERYGFVILIGSFLFLPPFKDALSAGIWYFGNLVHSIVGLPLTVHWAPIELFM
ncbi:MAG: site-2 protease family protein [Planctomycetes bacterium]|nr:site-2 protease family protein [Planctomycetota bacterium]